MASRTNTGERWPRGWVGKGRAAFLDRLLRTGSIDEAARAAQIAPARAYALRARCAVFAAAWDEARDESAIEFEARMRRRALGEDGPLSDAEASGERLAIELVRARKASRAAREAAAAAPAGGGCPPRVARGEVEARLEALVERLGCPFDPVAGEPPPA